MGRTAFRSIALVSGLVALAGSAFAQSPAGDSIKVHGAWTLEIHDPDGTLAGRHEFHNALVSQGQETLAVLLAGDPSTTRGLWTVQLVSPSAMCGARNCLIGEGTLSTSSDATLEVTAVGTPSPNAVRLHGSVTAVNAGSITAVATTQLSSTSYRSFSERWLPVPISIVAGQVITVTVLISFS